GGTYPATRPRSRAGAALALFVLGRMAHQEVLEQERAVEASAVLHHLEVEVGRGDADAGAPHSADALTERDALAHFDEDLVEVHRAGAVGVGAVAVVTDADEAAALAHAPRGRAVRRGLGHRA